MIFKNLFHRKKTSAPETRVVVIVGLGNPGREYAETRHNMGFLAVDHLASMWHADPFQEEKRFTALTTTVRRDGVKLILAKPLTQMNLSGKSVRAILDFYRLTPADLVVLHDEIDLAAGTVKVTNSSRSAGHNGVQNIIDTLGTQDFFRVRLGVGRPTETMGVCVPTHDYVLGRFTTEEKEHLPFVLGQAEAAVENFLKQKTAE